MTYVRRELGFSKRDEKIESNPHIDLCSAVGRGGKTEWRTALTWFKSRGFMQGGEGLSYMLHDRDDLTYHQAYSLALWWARSLGLPFTRSSNVLIWTPGRKRTRQERERLEKLLNARSQRAVDKLRDDILKGRI